MTVIDLIIRLQQMPQHLEVIYDRTPPHSKMFTFATAEEVDEIENPMNEKFVLISSGMDYIYSDN